MQVKDLKRILEGMNEEENVYFHTSRLGGDEILSFENEWYYDVVEYNGERWFGAGDYRTCNGMPEEKQISYDKMEELIKNGEAQRLGYMFRA